MLNAEPCRERGGESNADDQHHCETSKTATATKQIALLIAGARQAAGIDEWTSWDQFRTVCADYKRLDSGNFAKTIREMEDVFRLRKESERKLAVTLARPGWEQFAEESSRVGEGE